MYAPTFPECNGAPLGLYYDLEWTGVASREGFSDTGCRTADFGNACYNDHHYHFSYFVVSAAVLVKLKPEFSTNHALVSFVDTLIRDTTNPSLQDVHFPMFRSFDWFDLHSWSRGVIPSADGKDQESTSEELNLLYGIRLWGMVLQRESMQALGITMLALCASTIREFFLMTEDNMHHPPDFVRNHVTGPGRAFLHVLFNFVFSLKHTISTPYNIYLYLPHTQDPIGPDRNLFFRTKWTTPLGLVGGTSSSMGSRCFP